MNRTRAGDPSELVRRLISLRSRIVSSTNKLKEAIMADSDTQAVVDQMVEDVTAQEEVIDGAVVLITGFPAALAAAVEEARRNGLSEEQLASFTRLHTEMVGKTEVLKAALKANTEATAS